MATETIVATCAIAGGGPAGMMLGFLLARAGVDVLVLEKHADFFRDFRGDTIHPSTLEIMHELGILEAFLKRPHQDVHQLAALVGGERITLADFSHLPTHCRFIALMPQWDFLDFIAERAKRYPGFHLKMQARATDLIIEQGKVVGVRAETPDGPLEVRADVVVGADGRRSDIRERAELEIEDLGAPMDVLWFRLSRRADDEQQALGRIQAGVVFVTLDRGDYWQCAYVIPKGGFGVLQSKGLDAFRAAVARLNAQFADRVGEISSWNDVKLLTVTVDRLKRWYRPGLLCIGDAAHAMSPIGGVGINLAIQDAVASANILWKPLSEDRASEAVLAKVQERREWPTKMTQAMQLSVQKRIISSVLSMTQTPRPPLVAKLFNIVPFLRRIPARLLGLGVRPEHVRSPEFPSSP
jgi:2-polyprenyl-6-methoxyphenol hydroxylase-like FAD-dependent oxidoreductase